jgi:hypothetical protein
MPLYADLYLDQIDLTRHTGTQTCQVCKVDSLGELLDRLRSGQICGGQCVHWPRHRVEAFRTAIDAGEALPSVPSLDIPRPTEAGLFELNDPTPDSPIMITGNSQLTHEVLLAVLSTTSAPLWMLSVDSGGHTVDMSLVFKTLTAQTIAAALVGDESTGDESTGNDPRIRGLTGRIILPGLAEGTADGVSELLGRAVEVGPICAAELPLFFGAEWGG